LWQLEFEAETERKWRRYLEGLSPTRNQDIGEIAPDQQRSSALADVPSQLLLQPKPSPKGLEFSGSIHVHSCTI
jgi:hypothetical protein